MSIIILQITIFKAYDFEFSILTLWLTSWSPSMISFFNHPISLTSCMYQIFDSPLWIAFLNEFYDPFIVSVDRSFIRTMVSFN